jgi:uncharacterized surface protein with fasciclin (FAS1) repeats
MQRLLHTYSIVKIIMTKLSTVGFFSAVLFMFGSAGVQAQTIVEVAQGNDDFSALVQAVVSADLVDTLSSDGPFTVFAPTNAAFAALPGYILGLLESYPELLNDILLYHVAAEDLPSSSVVTMSSIATAGGEEVKVSARNGAFYIDDAKITALDIEADNGTIHVIDSVLIPDSVYTVLLAKLEKELSAIQALFALR